MISAQKAKLNNYKNTKLKLLKNKSDFSEELKKLPDDGRMTGTCRSVFKKF